MGVTDRARWNAKQERHEMSTGSFQKEINEGHEIRTGPREGQGVREEKSGADCNGKW